ncbi:hypothetical protein [Micromonospora sp. NPDC005710]
MFHLTDGPGIKQMLRFLLAGGRVVWVTGRNKGNALLLE